jgi:hypothetical protein
MAHVIHGDAWVHFFEREVFGGRSHRVAKGGHIRARDTASFIVGPGGTLSGIDRNGRIIHVFRAKEVIPDFRSRYHNLCIAHLKVGEEKRPSPRLRSHVAVTRV